MLRAAQAFSTPREPHLYALAYHRVDEPGHRPWLDPSLISATPAQFEAQMRLIAHAYHPVNAEDVLHALEGGKPLPPNAVLVTVDDGYCDFQEAILPIARCYGIQPLLFVPTGYVGSGIFWWDHLYQAIYHTSMTEIHCSLGCLPIETPEEKLVAMERLRRYFKQIPYEQAKYEIAELPKLAEDHHDTLNWNELRAAVRNGATLAPHTHSHSILSRVSIERAGEEICQSFDLLQQEVGNILPIFAFPDGVREAFTPEIIELLNAKGLKLVFTMIAGFSRLTKNDPLCFPRVPIWHEMSLAQFHWHLTPLHWKHVSSEAKRI